MSDQPDTRTIKDRWRCDRLEDRPMSGTVSARRTRVTALDLDSGESETMEIGPSEFIVICGGDRFLAHEQVSANGTNVITIKTYRNGGERR